MGAADPCYVDDERDYFPAQRVIPVCGSPGSRDPGSAPNGPGVAARVAGALRSGAGPTMTEAVAAIVASLPHAA